MAAKASIVNRAQRLQIRRALMLFPISIGLLICWRHSLKRCKCQRQLRCRDQNRLIPRSDRTDEGSYMLQLFSPKGRRDTGIELLMKQRPRVGWRKRKGSCRQRQSDFLKELQPRQSGALSLVCRW